MAKDRPIDKNVKSDTWHRYMGAKTSGKCFCCRERPIEFDNFDVGHVISRDNGGSDDIDNLRPICRPCNSGMKTMNMDEYRNKYFKSNTEQKTQRGAVKKKGKQREEKGSFAGVWIAIIIILLLIAGIWFYTTYMPQASNQQTAPKVDVWSKTSGYTLDDCYEVCKFWGANITDGVSGCENQCRVYSKFTIDNVTFEDFVNKIKSQTTKK